MKILPISDLGLVLALIFSSLGLSKAILLLAKILQNDTLQPEKQITLVSVSKVMQPILTVDISTIINSMKK